jgi:hypothetical protein
LLAAADADVSDVPLNSFPLLWIRGFILKLIKKAKFEGDKPLKWLGPSAELSGRSDLGGFGRRKVM